MVLFNAIDFFAHAAHAVISGYLTPMERALWEKCAIDHSRLEQERIPRGVVIPVLGALAEALESSQKSSQ